jgi:hypothetical protein
MEWLPIESAPTERLLLVSDGMQVAQAELDDGDWWARCGDLVLWDSGDRGAMYLTFTPTHYMLTPTPPLVIRDCYVQNFDPPASPSLPKDV